MGKATVVNLYKHAYDQYIGRQNDKLNLPHSDWANPYQLPYNATDEQRDLCLLRHAAYIQRHKMWRNIGELEGQRLGCYCCPKSCHGDTLAQMANAYTEAGRDVKAAHRELQITIKQLVTRLTFKHIPHCEVAVSGSRHMMCDNKITRIIEADDLTESITNQWDAHKAMVKDALLSLPVQWDVLHHGACYVGGADALCDQFARSRCARIDEHPGNPENKASFGARNHKMVHMVDALVAFWDGKKERSGTLNFLANAWHDEDWVIWTRFVDDEVIKQVFFGLRLSMLEEVCCG